MAAIIRIPVESNIGTQSVNVWHYQITNASPATEANEAINQLDTFYTAIAGALAAQIFTIGSRVVTVDQNPNLILATSSQTATMTGTGTSVLSAAALLRLQSGVVGGAHRGRIYLGPLDTNAVASNGRELASADQATIVAAAAALLTPTASGSRAVIWSRKNLTATVLSGVSVATTLGTQRRRLI